MDLTTAYYIVDSADDMLTAEELALRPEAEALINAGPAETVVTFETIETSAGPIASDRFWDLHYRGKNGNVSDDELDEYVAVEAYLAAEATAKAAAEETRKAELAALLAKEEAKAEKRLVKKFGAETVEAVRAWYNKYDGLAEGYIDCYADSGVFEDGIDSDEMAAFEAHLTAKALEAGEDTDEYNIHSLAMELRNEAPEFFPITNAMEEELERATANSKVTNMDDFIIAMKILGL
jgi:hypothetical protein